MGMLQLDAVVHWSIPVNDLEEAERFYGEILGLEHIGRLANSPMSCFKLGNHNILLCQRKDPLVRTVEQDGRLHHAFDVSFTISASKSTNPSTTGPAGSSPGGSSSSSILAATASNCAMRAGKRACRLRHMRRSLIRDRVQRARET